MSKKRRIFSRKQAGDTIVEVVIAIAVIAVVLTGAFVVTNRSLTAVRDSEEHSEALNLLQGQVEQLRNAADQSTFTQADLNNGAFCFLSNGNLQQPRSRGCTQNQLYDLSISECTSQCPPSGSGTFPFILTATWTSLNGGSDQVQLTYRVALN